jgi:hypothetical protein
METKDPEYEKLENVLKALTESLNGSRWDKVSDKKTPVWPFLIEELDQPRS